MPPLNNWKDISMTHYQTTVASREKEQWLTRYYFTRAGFSAVWVAAALTVGQQSASIAAALLIIYPAWDAAANFVDASRNGGLGNNRTQAINVAVSSVMTVAVVVALTMSMNWVLSAFGLWAIFSGCLAAWHGRSPLEDKWRPVGDGPQRRPIRRGRRILHCSGADARTAFHCQYCGVCRPRRLLFPRIGSMAKRQPHAAEDRLIWRGRERSPACSLSPVLKISCGAVAAPARLSMQQGWR